MQIQELKETIAQVIDEMKGEDLVTLDVRDMTDIADYMVIASGTSDRHVRAVAGKVIDELRDRGVRPLGVEGQQTGDWVLLDYGDVIVHIMRKSTREFYELEKLWSQEVAGLIKLNRESRSD